jgi:hypothetical protein
MVQLPPSINSCDCFPFFFDDLCIGPYAMTEYQDYRWLVWRFRTLAFGVLTHTIHFPWYTKPRSEGSGAPCFLSPTSRMNFGILAFDIFGVTRPLFSLSGQHQADYFVGLMAQAFFTTNWDFTFWDFLR